FRRRRVGWHRGRSGGNAEAVGLEGQAADSVGVGRRPPGGPGVAGSLDAGAVAGLAAEDQPAGGRVPAGVADLRQPKVPGGDNNGCVVISGSEGGRLAKTILRNANNIVGGVGVEAADCRLANFGVDQQRRRRRHPRTDAGVPADQAEPQLGGVAAVEARLPEKAYRASGAADKRSGGSGAEAATSCKRRCTVPSELFTWGFGGPEVIAEAYPKDREWIKEAYSTDPEVDSGGLSKGPEVDSGGLSKGLEVDSGGLSKDRKWISEAYPKDRKWIAEAYPKDRKWISEAYPKDWKWIAEAYPKDRKWISEAYPKDRKTRKWIAEAYPKDRKWIAEGGGLFKGPEVDIGGLSKGPGIKVRPSGVRQVTLKPECEMNWQARAGRLPGTKAALSNAFTMEGWAAWDLKPVLSGGVPQFIVRKALVHSSIVQSQYRALKSTKVQTTTYDWSPRPANSVNSSGGIRAPFRSQRSLGAGLARTRQTNRKLVEPTRAALAPVGADSTVRLGAWCTSRLTGADSLVPKSLTARQAPTGENRTDGPAGRWTGEDWIRTQARLGAGSPGDTWLGWQVRLTDSPARRGERGCEACGRPGRTTAEEAVYSVGGPLLAVRIERASQCQTPAWRRGSAPSNRRAPSDEGGRAAPVASWRQTSSAGGGLPSTEHGRVTEPPASTTAEAGVRTVGWYSTDRRKAAVAVPSGLTARQARAPAWDRSTGYRVNMPLADSGVQMEMRDWPLTFDQQFQLGSGHAGIAELSLCCCTDQHGLVIIGANRQAEDAAGRAKFCSGRRIQGQCRQVRRGGGFQPEPLLQENVARSPEVNWVGLCTMDGSEPTSSAARTQELTDNNNPDALFGVQSVSERLAFVPSCDLATPAKLSVPLPMTTRLAQALKPDSTAQLKQSGSIDESTAGTWTTSDRDADFGWVDAVNSNNHMQPNPEPPRVQPTDETKNAAAAQASTTDNSQKVSKKSNMTISEERNAKILPMKKNPLYNVNLAIEKLNEYPMLKVRKEGKLVRKNKRGEVIPTIREEKLGPIESVVSRFCQDVLCISRADTLPLSSQGERHLIWVSSIKAKHIINHLNGNGCYVVNRFPGGVFLKDKQVMGTTLREFMLERRNYCMKRCGANEKTPVDDSDDEDTGGVTYRICTHMVQSMRTDEEGCTDEACYNFGKQVCKHLDIFIPEVQSFSSYNALQDFSNRLDDELKGQLFVCKPSYLYKGLGFRFFHKVEDFQKFYHMTIGKETSRHDFLVQRVIKDPYLFNGRKVDIRAFMLIMTLRYRRVVAFINPGFCRVASAEYEPFNGQPSDEDQEPEEPENTKPMTPRKMRDREAEELDEKMQMLACPYQTKQERAERARRMSENQLFTDREDRSKELDEVFRSESLLEKIKGQIKHIGMRLASAIESKIWDAYGCYQIFGLDLCVDENHKVWLLEVNSQAMSEVDLLSPTQRVVVPAVIMESIGLVVECMYKSKNGLRLRKSPIDEFKETGFLFAQNFTMVFSTLKRRRTDYLPPRKPPPRVIPFYQRVDMVDHMIRQTDQRKFETTEMRRKVLAEKANYKSKVKAKDEEES
uniref:Tubulin--tyrosine ligase-like protein 9 n=1 Tax=Macrostomum lignano TaxID=282301 RepID=A0A1I8HX18_9PLAT